MLEINSGIYPSKLQKQYKAVGESLFPIILSNVGLFNELLPDRAPGTVEGVSVLGESNTVTDNRYSYAFRNYGRTVNVYNISLQDFRKILEYINKVFSYSFGLVLDPKQMSGYISSSFDRKFYWLKEKRFIDYLNLYHTKEDEVFQSFLKKYREVEGKEFVG